jgi:hypothetical protein
VETVPNARSVGLTARSNMQVSQRLNGGKRAFLTRKSASRSTPFHGSAPSKRAGGPPIDPPPIGVLALWVHRADLLSNAGLRVNTTADESASMTPLDVLQRENALLRGTISTSEGVIANLEGALGAAGVDVPAVVLPEALDIQSAAPEDFWSPAMNVPEGHEYKEIYGKISPVPEHDGTECFKWDETLWSKENHFRVMPWLNFVACFNINIAVPSVAGAAPIDTTIS